MTRRASILIYSLAIVVLLLGLQSWSIAIGRVERHVIASVEHRTGLKVTNLARVEIALLPLPRISLTQVAFERADKALTGTAVKLRARARLLPLLIGRLSFDRIDLIGSELNMDVQGQDNAGGWLAAPLTYLDGLESQSKLVINTGAVFLRLQGAIVTILRDVNLIVEERDARNPVAVSGTVNWRGVASDVSLLWPRAGDQARLSVTLASEPLNLRFEGLRSGLTEPVVNGQLTLSTKSLPALFGWLGERPHLADAIGQLSLTAQAQLKPGEASLSSVVAAIDGERLQGVLKLAESGPRWSLSGTLAGAALDIGRFAQGLEQRATSGIGSRPKPLDFETWTAHDVDLRISVDTARIEGLRLGDVATYLLIKKGRFEAGLLGASAYGGTAKGRLLATASPNGTDVRLQATLDRVNLARSAGDLPQWSRISGLGSLQATLEGVGATREEVLASLSGKASVVIRQGEVGGFALVDLLRRAERNPAVALRDWRQGRTPFETASLNATVANGHATITDATMSHAAYRLALTGQASLTDRWLDLSGQLTPSVGPLRIPVALRGTFGALELSPDTQATPRPSDIQPTAGP